MKRTIALLALAGACAPVIAEETKPFDAAAAFGARPSVSGMRLSPDGKSVAYHTPIKGQGTALYTLSLADGAKPTLAIASDGKPERLGFCNWVANDRLACYIEASLKDPTYGIVWFDRIVAVNADSSNLKLLSKPDTHRTRGLTQGGGQVVDWLPGEDGAVLMTRHYLPTDQTGNRLGSSTVGLGLDHLDTRTLTSKRVEMPRTDAEGYISDGRGTVRIVVIGQHEAANLRYQDTGVTEFMYRPANSTDWHKLSEWNSNVHTGFFPSAVDPDRNVAIGFKNVDGHLGVYSVGLDDSHTEQLLYVHPDVDVNGLISIGRQGRVVGVTYATDKRHAVYFDPEIKQLLASLGRALPQQPLVDVVDSSVDGNMLLIFAESDSDPGVYYLFDKKARKLQTFLVARDQLEGVKLASQKPITYPSSDGVMVPGYLTLPPGVTTAKGLPAIVLPHGGPSARDEWGFDWLSQFFAARGYAVLQPEFRGSAGYGEAWLKENGLKSWKIAIGDVVAAGHWLIDQGIADPHKLGIFGWSYGGYAALQSAVVEPDLFKAVVAVAPVTDLAALKQESRLTTGYDIVSNYIGDGPHIREGSPLQNADKIKAPVLLFHAAMDLNVRIEESRSMAERIKATGGRCELVTWDDLDHQLNDSEARALMLRKSDAFLRQGFGM